MKKRNYGLDLLRILLCIFVIAVHSLNYFGIESVFVEMFIPTLLKSANGLFYMLSGYFNLDKKFNNSKDILRFYKSKFIYVLIPFLGFNLFWAAWDFIHEFATFNFIEYLGVYYKTIMSSANNGHMWFLYPLFGMLLSTPFISKMLHSMDDDELKLLWRISIGFNIVCYFLCENFGISFKVLSWFMEGWIIYYFAGYYYKRIASKENSIKWIALGLVGYIVTCLGVSYKLPVFKTFTGGNDIQPMFTLFCMGFLFVWCKVFNIANEKLGKVIVFLSTNTFLVYLFHIRGLEYVVRKLNIVEANAASGFTAVFATFAVSLIAAVVVNAVMKPMQKLLDKIWTVK